MKTKEIISESRKELIKKFILKLYKKNKLDRRFLSNDLSVVESYLFIYLQRFDLLDLYKELKNKQDIELKNQFIIDLKEEIVKLSSKSTKKLTLLNLGKKFSLNQKTIWNFIKDNDLVDFYNSHRGTGLKIKKENDK